MADFDWEEFEGTGEKKSTVTLDHLRQVFSGGSMELSQAVSRLATIAGVSGGHAYKELGDKGKFARHLSKEGRIISFKA